MLSVFFVPFHFEIPIGSKTCQLLDMRKMLICCFALAMGIIAGCKKDGQKGPVYLLQQQITDDRADGYPLDTAFYSYDNKNRITSITDGTGEDKIKYIIDYDNKDRVTSARKYNSTGGLVITFDFFYNNNVTGYYFYGPGENHIADTAYFTFNGNKQLTKITTKHSGWQTFGYDGMGNISTTQGFKKDGSTNLNSQISFTYDDKKNPLLQSSPNNYFYMYVVRIGNPSTLLHNVTVRNSDRFTYTYNDNGYPTGVIIYTALTKIFIDYKYITQ